MANLILGYSGGLDSTYILWKKLVENTDKITALYVDDSYLTQAQNADQGDRYPYSAHQVRAAEDCIAWLKSNVRDFDYVRVNNYEYPAKFDNPVSFSTICLWTLEYAIKNYVNKGLADSVIFGLHSDMKEELSEGNTGRCYHAEVSPKPGTSKSYMIEQMKTIWATATSGAAIRFPILAWHKDSNRLDELEFPIMAVNEMPGALLNLTLSCRVPTLDSDGDLVSCGTCWKCTQEKYISDEIAKTTANTAIATALRASSGYTNDKGRIQADWTAHTG